MERQAKNQTDLAMDQGNWVICPDCDQLYRFSADTLSVGDKVTCSRCGALLSQKKADTYNRALAYTLTSLVLFIIANSFPLLTLKMGGREQASALFTGVQAMAELGMWDLAVLVFATTILVPLLQILGMLFVLMPLRFNIHVGRPALIFRIVKYLAHWGMVEVFMLGVLAAIVKLISMAEVVPNIALFAFAGLMFTSAAASSSLDSGAVWRQLDRSS
ncbi:MAG: paraquat-inducible protein A [Magnetococcales bacterium]|nr:paraquat-inducible protein A [Magnetococcales bacterium]